MSSFQDSGWLRRLWSLAKPGDPVTEFVQNVHLVQDRRWSSSRERAPYAAHSGFLLAAGAGVHNFVELRGVDALAATVNLLHACRWEEAMVNTLTGLMSWVIADGSALTTATRVNTTPAVADSDPDVRCELFIGTIATANIPASAVSMPRSNGIGQTAATPSFQSATTEFTPAAGLPFCLSWPGPRSLMLFGGANQISAFHVLWQAIRS